MQYLIVDHGLGQPNVVVLSQQQIKQPYWNEQFKVGS
jgi:hypothetical protein